MCRNFQCVVFNDTLIHSPTTDPLVKRWGWQSLNVRSPLLTCPTNLLGIKFDYRITWVAAVVCQDSATRAAVELAFPGKF